MFFNSKKSKYPTEAQIEVWLLNRSKNTGRAIAKQKNVTPAFVSKSLKEANRRINELLEGSARANRIKINFLNVELGFARGMSEMLKVKAFITFSPSNGIQVWYEHKGDCANCEVYDECRDALFSEFKDRKIKIENPTLAPTDLGEILFEKLEILANKQQKDKE